MSTRAQAEKAGNPVVDALSDDDLVAAYLGGDQAAFETLYGRHRGPVYRFFLRQLSEAEAKDAFQDAWAKLIQSLDRYQPQGKFVGYLFSIAHSVLNDAHRRHMREPPRDGEVEAQPARIDLEADTARDELRACLYAEVAKLPLNQRSVWILKQETGLSMQDIATMTETSVEGVKSRLRYAAEKLKAGMQKYV